MAAEGRLAENPAYHREIDVGKDAENLDHLITPEQRLSVAMAHQ
jgi:hypothetical protein